MLPASETAATPHPPNADPLPLATMVQEVLESTEDIADEEPSLSSIPDECRLSPVERKRKQRRSGIIIRKILRQPPKTSFQTKSSLTLIDSEESTTANSKECHTKLFHAIPKAQPAEQRYLPRQTAFYYLADPYIPELDVDMPIPAGDTVAIRLDNTGQVKAASLNAFVRLLTSKDSVLDQEFIPTFFLPPSVSSRPPHHVC